MYQKNSLDEHLKLISESFLVIQEWLDSSIEDDPNRHDLLHRLAIIHYELGDISKMLAYRRSVPTSPRCGNKEIMKHAIGDSIVQLITLSAMLGIDTFKAIPEALLRLQNKEWSKA